MKYVSRIGLLLAIVLAVPAVLAEEGRMVQQLRPIDTKAGVTVSIQMTLDRSKADAFVVQPIEGGARITCALPHDEKKLALFKMGLLPRIDADAKLLGIDVATWRPLDPTEGGEQPELTPVSGEKRRIETDALVTVRTITKEAAGQRTLVGFELSVLVRGKAPEAGGAADPSAEEEEGEGEAEPEAAVEYRKIVIDLPAQPSEKLRYGLILTPVWKDKGAGRTLEGFDAALASMPREHPAG
jgi:hypothetical protein